MRNAKDNFRDSMLDELGYAPKAVKQGRVNRFPTNGQRSDRSGWCKLFADGSVGVFGDFRTHRVWLWTAIDHDTLTWAEKCDLAEQTNAAAHADPDVALMMKRTDVGAPKPPRTDPSSCEEALP
jgi:putative DNA primase/helicase